MVQFIITIFSLATSTIILVNYKIVCGGAIRFDRFGGRLMRVFTLLEWYQFSVGTYPLRFGSFYVQTYLLRRKWKRILHEERYHYQFNCERASNSHS